MESRAKAFGHPIHPMLIPFPLGLLSTAVVFDLIHLFSGDGKWADIAFYMVAAGIVGGVAAALFGWIDWFAIPADTRAKRVGLMHGGGNALVLVLFALSWLLRLDAPRSPEALALVLSFAGVALAGFTGWLGGELVDRMGVGVDHGANLDSPNSLSGKPAADGATRSVRAANR